MNMPAMPTGNDPLSTFFGQTSGGVSAQLAQQMQQFMLALQFQQQQAALAQAQNVGTQYGFAPGGNWMTWGQGGPTTPAAGTPTSAELLNQMQLGQGALGNALQTAGVTGQFAQPLPTQYTPGTVLTAPSSTPGLGPAYGVVNQDGSVTMASSQSLQQLAAQRGTTPQALTQNAAPVDFQTLQKLSMGPNQGPTQQTLAALQQQYAQALASAGVTGQFRDPSQTADALLQQGKAMNGQSFNDLPPDQQQFWLQWNANNPTQAAQQWARGVNGALQQAGYQNPAAQGQQTLASQLQNATLTGQYQGAPTEAASEFARNLAQQQAQFQQTFGLSQGQLTGTYQGAPTEQASEFARNLALQQGQLGQQYLATASQLQGPQNTFQQSNYLRGAAANPNVPVYLQALQNNMGLPSFQATGGQAPTPASAAGLAAGMGYGSPASGTGSGTDTSGGATAGWNYGDTLNAIKGIASSGAQALGPGSLERLSPDELQAFGSGLGAAGYSLPSFMSQYQSSRVGQQAPVTAMGVS
jgi:hypothetical protein